MSRTHDQPFDSSKKCPHTVVRLHAVTADRLACSACDQHFTLPVEALADVSAWAEKYDIGPGSTLYGIAMVETMWPDVSFMRAPRSATSHSAVPALLRRIRSYIFGDSLSETGQATIAGGAPG